MSHTAWFRQAESDLDAASVLSDAGHHSQAVWLAAQAVEKAHKAILAALGLRYEERHFRQLGHRVAAIAALLPTALHDPVDPRIAEMIATLEAKADSSRYPRSLEASGGGVADGSTDLAAPAVVITASRHEVDVARELVGWCKDRIARAKKAVLAMRPEGPPVDSAGAG